RRGATAPQGRHDVTADTGRVRRHVPCGARRGGGRGGLVAVVQRTVRFLGVGGVGCRTGGSRTDPGRRFPFHCDGVGLLYVARGTLRCPWGDRGRCRAGRCRRSGPLGHVFHGHHVGVPATWWTYRCRRR